MKKKLCVFFTMLVMFSGPVIANADTYVDDESGTMTKQVPDSSGAINTAEQSIIDELNKGTSIDGKIVYFNPGEMNAVYNYCKRNNLTQEQADGAIANIRASREVFEAQSASIGDETNIHMIVRKMPVGEVKKMMNYITAAGKCVGLKVTWQAGVATFEDEYTYTLADTQGNIVYQSGSPVKSTGATLKGGANIAIVLSLFLVSVIGCIILKCYGRGTSSAN